MYPAFRSIAASAALLSLWLAPVLSAQAVVTATWTVESYKDFDKGEAKSAFITSLGEVKPGWDTSRTELEVDGVWSSVRTDDGSLLVGTDDGGSIYRIARGKGKGKDKVSKLATIKSAVATVSLALGADGTLYAGTMPAGEVWKIDTGSGKADKLATLTDAETVWSLTLSKDGKTLYAGTGPKGALWSIDVKSGKSKTVFSSEDKRITALVTANDGAIWLGTSDKAQVFRYDPKRKATRAIADFSGNEITALADAGDSVMVAANDFNEPSTTGIKTKSAVAKSKGKGKEGEKPKMPSAGDEPGADSSPSSSSEPVRVRSRKGKGALYRVFSDGRMEQMHALTATYYTDLTVTSKGQIFAGAGDKGRIYLIDTDDSVSTAYDVEERIIAAMFHDDKTGLTFVTSDAAAMYRTTGIAKKAEYLSDVYDTKVPSQFGKLVWHASGAIKVETRSGNTAKPGVGWSQFAAPKNARNGGGGSRSARVASPAGRYVQYRVSFTSGDAVVRKTRMYYLPHNRPSELSDVTVAPSGETKGLTLATGAASPRSPIMKLKWKVENPDGDKTRYKLAVRREGDALWRPIATEKKPLTSKSYSWNTETFPDGYYRLRVTAIDDRSNSADRARETHKTTPLFLIDNQKPTVAGVSVSYPKVAARASDDMSPISEMAYSVDDGPWRVGTTTDGMFDDLTEMLRISLPDDLSPGVHTLAIRVADERGNIGSASVTFRVK